MKKRKNSSLEAQGSTKRVWVELFIVAILLISLILLISATVEDGQTANDGGNDCGNDINITATARTNGFISWVLLGSRGSAMTANISIIQDSVMLATKTGSFDINDQRPINFTLGDYSAPLSSSTANGVFQIKITAVSGTNLNCKSAQTFSGTLFNYSSQTVNWKSFSDDNDVILKYSDEITPPAAFPNITLNLPTNNSNQTNEVNFVVTANSSNSTFQLTNVSLYLNGALNETKTITGTGNITTFSKTVSVNTVHNWTAYTCDQWNCSQFAANRSFTAQKIYEESQDFNAQGLESSSQTFRVNVSLSSGYTISAVNLTYNSTNYTATFAAYNSTLYQATATVSLPSVTANTNKTFNWTFLLTDTTVFRSSNQTQTVLNLGLDNCGANNITILNFTLANERTQVALNATGDNTSIKVDMTLYSDAAKTTVANSFAALYNQTLPARVCISEALGTTQFYMDTTVEYTANNYQREFYNIRNYSLNATANPSQNITLFDLLTSEAQVFTITYRDENFLPVSGALVQVGRYYVDEGRTKTVEIPITDVNGQTVANLVVNDVIYTFTITKNGQLLGIFANNIAKCQTPLVSPCTIDLNSFSGSIDVSNFTEEADFFYTLTYDKLTREVSSTFTIPSGAVSTVLLNVTAADAISTFLCSQNLTTSSGTLTCTIPSSFGNQTAYATLYKDGNLIAFGQINSAQDPSDIYAGILVFVGILIILTLIGAGLSDNPVYTAIFLIVGFGALVALNLVANNGFVGGLATILWLVIAIILIILKGGNRT